MGLDVGAKTIGVAVCDPDHRVATPLQTIKRVKFTKDIQALQALVQRHEVGGFVVGLPLHLDEREGRRAQSVRDFCLELARYPEIVGDAPWIALWDERLSTVAVTDFVDAFVTKKSKRRGAKESGLIDRLAAQLILDGALDYLRAHPSEP